MLFCLPRFVLGFGRTIGTNAVKHQLMAGLLITGKRLYFCIQRFIAGNRDIAKTPAPHALNMGVRLQKMVESICSVCQGNVAQLAVLG